MKNIKLKDVILLQLVVIIYTLNSIIAKFATGCEVFSFGFFAFYAAEIGVLGVYAICWQQMIKKFDLSVAYANRAMAIMWTGLWAVIIFHDRLKVNQIIGIIIIVIGTIIVNYQKSSEEKEAGND